MTLEWDPALPERCLLDPVRLKQVLSNLLDNAIKFTPAAGRITVRVSSSPASQGLHFEVTDTGEGIAEDMQPLVFEKFFKHQGLHVFGDAFTRVGHFKVQALRSWARTHTHGDATRGGGELDGVVQQVAQHLLEPHGVEQASLGQCRVPFQRQGDVVITTSP